MRQGPISSPSGDKTIKIFVKFKLIILRAYSACK